MLRCCYHIVDPRDEHVLNLYTNANVQMLDVRREKTLLCIWRNIQNGYIETYSPIRTTRANKGITIRNQFII